MKILITGVGVTGKSSLRRLLVRKLRYLGLPVEHFDSDLFRELRDQADIDCLEALPDVFQEKVIYVVEDIHGLVVTSATLPLESYDLILYLKPDTFSHLMFWLKRSWTWFKIGRFSWDPKRGWKGTGKPRDFHNIVPIFKVALRDFQNRKKWIFEDLQTIASFHYIIVYSQWTRRGIKFRIS